MNTMQSTESTETSVVAVGDEGPGTYLDWPAIIGGIILASAISLVLLTFGSAIGLSLSGFVLGGEMTIGIAVVAGLWLVWVQVSSFMAGGYLAGRMRRRHNDATEDEVDVRDGAHGLLVWAGALVLGAVIAASGIGAVANAVGNAAGAATMAAASAAPDDAGERLIADFSAMMLRSDRAVAGDAARSEIARTIGAAEGQTLSQTDLDYLAGIVARETGLTGEQANARVAEILGMLETAEAEATELADKARKTGIIAAFVAAASLLVSAAGAYWAAGMGGHHRDNNIVFRTVFRRI